MNDIETLLRGSTPQEIDDALRAQRRLIAHAYAQGLIDVTYALIDSPLGPLLIAATRRGLVRIAFAEERIDTVLERLVRELSPRVVEAAGPLDPIKRELDEYFTGARRTFDLMLDWKLIGAFARKVLRVTSAIPYGNVSTYGDVASGAGSPRGSRAAGNALGSNPIPIVIPCHRVLRAGGALGGYAGGPERKRFLLGLEGALADTEKAAVS